MFEQADRVASVIAAMVMLIGLLVTLRLYQRRYPPGAGAATAGPSDELPPVWNVPHRPVVFVGRADQLDELRHGLRAVRSTVMIQALHGLGGIGKTTLAIEYANRAAGDYDIVWWVDAEESARVPEQLARLAVVADWAGPEVDVATAVDITLRRLGTTSRWLIIFDNADHPDQLIDLLPQGPGHILITTRNAGWGQYADGLRLGSFTRAESASLLRAKVPGLSVEKADEVAAALGDLPLAVSQAAAFLQATGMPAASYIAELRRHPADVLGEAAPGQRQSLMALVTMAERRVAEADPAAAQVLHIVAFLAPEPFPVDGFALAAEAGVLPEPLASAAASPTALRRTLATTATYGLTQLNAEGLQMHRLTQAALRVRLPDEESVRRTAAGVVTTALPLSAGNPLDWPRWTALLPHLLAIDPAVHDEPVRQGFLRAVEHMLIRGDAPNAERLGATLVHRWRLHFGPDDHYTLSAAHLLAEAYRDTGRYEQARALDQDTLTRRRHVLGENSLDSLASANSLAVNLFLLGRPEQARVLDEQTAARMREVLGEDHPATLIAASNLARDLSALGRVTEARAINEELLASRRRVLGDDDPDTLVSAANLAADLQVLGERELALRIHEDVLTRRRRIFGDDHPDTLVSASNVARVLSSLGRYQQARDLDEDTLARRRRSVGEDHPDTLVSAGNLAVDLQILGEYEQARAIHLDVLARRKRILGENHPDTLATTSNLALVLGALGEHEQASRFTGSTLSALRALLGDDHPDTLAAANNHAAALRATGDVEEARRLDEATLERRRRVLGEDHPDTLASVGNLAIDMQLIAGRTPAEDEPDD